MLCLLVLVAVFVPLAPLMPAASLDGSWMTAMNQAVAQSSVFGREMIFTFGPYASVYTRTYHPATDHMMLMACLYLAVSCWACLFLLARSTGWRLPFLYCLVLAGAMQSRDAVLLACQLLAALTIFATWRTSPGESRETSPLMLLVILGPFGLLPLVKGSMLILCVAISLLCTAYFLFRKSWLAALLSVATPWLSIAVFWIAAGQPLGALRSYFSSMSQIIGGYTEAMMSDADPVKLCWYLLACGFILFGIAIQSKTSWRDRVFLLALYFLFLFLSFKAAFVRADHIALAGDAILLAGVLLPFFIRNKAMWAFTLIACCGWLSLSPQGAAGALAKVPSNLEMICLDAVQGLDDRVGNGAPPAQRFDATMLAIRKGISFPPLSGTADIYPYDLTYVFAAGYAWQPRPVLQSYSVYTPYLSEANRQHLAGARAPENLIFKVGSLDRRIPSIDDGASWPILLARYHIGTRSNGYLFLKKNAGNVAKGISDDLMPAGAGAFALGEKNTLPSSKGPLFVRIDIAPTWLGKLAAILYKPAQLQLELMLEDGTKRSYSAASGMLKSGFLLSPLVENNDDFAALYQGEPAPGKAVKALTLLSTGHGGMFWQENYNIAFYSFAGHALVAHPAAADNALVPK